jgi:hypothetical protein
MPVVQNAVDVKNPKVKEGGIVYPSFQTVSIASAPSVFQVPIQPAASVNGLQSRNTIIFDLETNEVSNIENFYFRLTVTNGGSSTIDLAPVFDWFEYTLAEADKGIGHELSSHALSLHDGNAQRRRT